MNLGQFLALEFVSEMCLANNVVPELRIGGFQSVFTCKLMCYVEAEVADGWWNTLCRKYNNASFGGLITVTTAFPRNLPVIKRNKGKEPSVRFQSYLNSSSDESIRDYLLSLPDDIKCGLFESKQPNFSSCKQVDNLNSAVMGAENVTGGVLYQVVQQSGGFAVRKSQKFENGTITKSYL